MRASPLLVMTALATMAQSAVADEIVRGTVVRLEEDEIYFDLGRPARLAPGQVVRLLRPIQLPHPVSGQTVADELPLGTMNVAVVGEFLSMAHSPRELAYPPQVGDFVEARIRASAPASQPTPLLSEPPPPEVDPDTSKVLSVFRASAGETLDTRIAAWESFLQQNPETGYASVVTAELERLRATRDRFLAQEARARVSDPTVPGIEHTPPQRWRWHMPLGLVFAAPTRTTAAWLHYRRLGTDTYRKSALSPEGDDYLRGALAAAEVDAPGLEYFVEVVTDSGLVGAAVGTPYDPIRVAVEPPRISQLFGERRHRSRISTSVSFLDFAAFDGRGERYADTLLVVEADFFYRLHRTLYGMRMGMGVLNGRGGFAEPTQPEPIDAGFNYGFAEVELRAGQNIAVMPRLIAGLGRDGLGFGVEGRARLGPEHHTNITFGLSSLAEVGFVTEVHMQWTLFPRIPLGFGIAVGDQPNEGDLGVRLSTDIGLRTLSWMVPTLKISYQGRSIRHSGVGAGLGLVFDW